jgi:pimeloyl-ACP methyl ester carboxylesterase
MASLGAASAALAVAVAALVLPLALPLRPANAAPSPPPMLAGGAREPAPREQRQPPAAPSTGAATAERWLILPPTPSLPPATHSGYAAVNGIRIWYAEFGAGPPVILLHGGLASSDYWGLQVRALAGRYRVIVMDSRGHGRSSRDEQPFGYDLMAADVLALMDHLRLERAAIVGWSDGAILGLDIAIHHPERLTKLFAFGANSDPSGVADSSRSPVFTAYIARAEREYDRLSPTPGQYREFLAQINRMWDSQPNFSPAELRAITTPAWIVDGDHDEAIKRENTELMAAEIPGAGLLLQPAVSHFSFLQDAQQFNADLLHFLAVVPDAPPPVGAAHWR